MLFGFKLRIALFCVNLPFTPSLRSTLTHAVKDTQGCLILAKGWDLLQGWQRHLLLLLRVGWAQVAHVGSEVQSH